MNILFQINIFLKLVLWNVRSKLPTKKEGKKEMKKKGLFAYWLVFKDVKILLRGEDPLVPGQLMAGASWTVARDPAVTVSGRDWGLLRGSDVWKWLRWTRGEWLPEQRDRVVKDLNTMYPEISKDSSHGNSYSFVQRFMLNILSDWQQHKMKNNQNGQHLEDSWNDNTTSSLSKETNLIKNT